ncbi:MAG: Uma2 family endonuclease [Gemmatimonadota bacterium]
MALSSITWQNVQHMPDDGNRYEAIEGDLYMTPAPTVRHQRVTLRIYRALHQLLQEADYGEVFCAPLGVEFPATDEGVQPDILFVSNERRGIIADAWLVGAPNLVAEILPGTDGAIHPLRKTRSEASLRRGDR